MQMTDIILKKRDGFELSKEEIEFFIKNYVNNSIPDYQASALAMAIYFQGMNKKEISFLTDSMLHSGEIIDLSSIKGVKIDKHSTGGVGDKTSLVLGPLVASCGAKVAKMSGRGLGHTGGTLDKLESIKGVSVNVSKENFIKQVNDIGIAIIGQTGDLVPADKKLYALRDVTATVDSIPLIASSIMSKKLASGADTILLDVKFGSGAFMKDIKSAEELASTMVEIGKHLNRDTKAVLTDMDQPLGMAIGNSLEVIEACETLKGRGPKDLVELCLNLGAIILKQAHIEEDIEKGKVLLQSKIDNLEAFKKLEELIKYQGGDISYLEDYSKFEKSKYQKEIYSSKEGYVEKISALEIGECAMHLGAGRATKDDVIDMSSGIVLNKKVGDFVKKGELLLTCYTNKENVEEIYKDLENSYIIVQDKVLNHKIIHEIIG
ncbi:pyrimidine-nucleoside phosphorylase [Firmicutes bacterium CAG:449]|nr:pyrimidine-nucleoside phosphorylase [Firmicutes bacterium CAG:449]